VVCPDADLKIFLTASPAERAHRRLVQVGGSPDQLAAVQEALEERDRRDSSRAIAPLVAAEDAIEVNTDGKSIEAVIQTIRDLLASRLEEHGRADR
jgi:pantoate ligase/cytidylate kinase